MLKGKKYFFIFICFSSLFFSACSNKTKYYKAMEKTNNIQTAVNKTGFCMQDLNNKKDIVNIIITTNTNKSGQSITKLRENINNTNNNHIFYGINNKEYEQLKNKVVPTSFDKNEINNYLNYFKININKLIGNNPNILKNALISSSKFEYKSSFIKINIFELVIPNNYFEEILKKYLNECYKRNSKTFINKISNLNKFNSLEKEKLQKKLDVPNTINRIQVNNCMYTFGVNEDNYILTQNLQFDLKIKGFKDHLKYSLYSDLDYINEDIKLNIPNF